MKKYLSPYFWGLLICGTAAVLMLAGCASKNAGGASAIQRKAVSGFKKIAVAPFQAVTSDDPDAGFVQCPVCKTTFRTSVFTGTPEKKIEELFLKGMASSKHYSLVPSEYVQRVYKRVSNVSSGESQLEILTEVGKEVGADGIIAGYLFYYTERKGFDYSVEKPASVAFCIHLISVEDGVPVWKGVFDKTQKSLMENIFDIIPFIKGGGKWVTVETLSQEGIEKILQDLPDMKGDS